MSAASVIEVERAAAVDGDGDFRRELCRRAMLRASARRRSAASAPASRISSGSSPASGLADAPERRLPPRCRAHATAAANRGADAALKPRTWMLPRAVISMMPLPCSRAAAQSSRMRQAKWCRSACSRTSNPSPVGIGAESPGQAPRRMPSPWGGVMGSRRESCTLGPSRLRTEQPHEVRHRHRCGADAKSRAAARHRAARQSRRRLADFRAAESRARRDRRHKPRAADRTIRWPPRRSFRAKATRRSTVSASSAAPRGPWRIWPAMKRGLTARARTMRASAADSVRARGRCGSVISSMTRSAARPSIFAAAAKPPTKAASSAPSRRSRPGSSLGMHQQIGAGDALRESAGRRAGLAIGAAIGCARRRRDRRRRSRSVSAPRPSKSSMPAP